MRLHVVSPAVLMFLVILSATTPAAAARSQRPTATESYRIRQGDSLWTVARRYGTTAEQLARINRLSTKATLQIGQRLKVPARVKPRSVARAAAPRAVARRTVALRAPLAPVAPTGSMTAVYQVRSGDTLWILARRHGITPERLAAMNGVSAGAILSIGQRLRIPAPSPPNPSAAPVPPVDAKDDQPAASAPPPAAPEVQKPSAPVVTNPPAAAVRPRKPVLPSRGAKWSAAIVRLSTRFLGVRYRWGGASPQAFDCSGLLYYVYALTGVSLPRTTFDMFDAGRPVPNDQLQSGDIVFFQTLSPGPSHAGIYLGDGRFIHSSSGFGRVTITPMNHRYYAPRYLGARRF